MITLDMPIIKNPELVLSKIIATETCWNWAAAINKNGYGVICIKTDKKRTYKAHRIVMSIFGIEMIENTVIDHMCMNRKCVNPDHLRQVSLRVNNIENSGSMAAKWIARDRCNKGHEYTEDNTFFRPGKKARNCKKCNRENATRYYLEQLEIKNGRC